MEVPNMKNFIRSSSLLAVLAAATLLAGCGSSGVGDIFGGNDTSNRNDPYEQRIDNVRGTVESVNTRERTIVVDAESTGYSNNLRNGDDEVVLSYDDRTTVEFQGRTFRPEDLEPGDRILAEVSPSYRSNTTPLVEEIQVLHDVSGGIGDNDDYRDNDSYATNQDVRGTVRYVDTRDRTVEVETSSRSFTTGSTGQSGVVVVHYDAETVVEFEGRRYQPENLERGDEVQIDIRNVGGRLLAEEIQVVADARSR